MNLDVNSFTDENGEPVMYATASNLSPASPEYEALVAERVEALTQQIRTWPMCRFPPTW